MEEKYGEDHILSVTRQELNLTAYSHATLFLLRRSVTPIGDIVVEGNNAITKSTADFGAAAYHRR